MTDRTDMPRPRDGILDIAAYVPGKSGGSGEGKVHKLSSNESPLGPSPAAMQAYAECMQNLALYPDGGSGALREALAETFGINPANIVCGAGSDELLQLLASGYLQPGDEAIHTEHGFLVYPIVIRANGATPVVVAENNLTADIDAILGAVTSRTRMVFLANPNNPTGTWVGEDALVQFLDALPEHVWMVLDEAYFEYVEADSYPDGIRLLERYPNLIVTRTFSKIYGLAALRVGYAVSSPYVAELLNRARQPFNVNALALAGAEAALQDSAYVEQSRRLNASGMAQVTQGLTALGLNFIPSLGNFLSFAVPESAAALDVYNALLREGVIVRPIAEYGLPGHLRATIGLPEENARFLEALGRVLS